MASAAVESAIPMAISPGLDALATSPFSASNDSLHLTDYLDLGASQMTSSASTNSSNKTTSQTQEQYSSIAPSQPPEHQSSKASSQPPEHQSSKAPSQSLEHQSSSASSSSSAPPSSSSSCKPNMSMTATANATTITTNTNTTAAAATPPPPPPPGSPPEQVFRHYLRLELKKMGSPADDSIIDKYVQQHYGTFLKAMETGPSATAATTPAQPTKPLVPSTSSTRAVSDAAKVTPTPKQSAASQASVFSSSSSSSSSAPLHHHRHATRSHQQSNRATTPSQTEVSTGAIPADVDEAATTQDHLSSMSPQPQPQPFKVPLASDAFSATSAPLLDSIDPHYIQFGGSPFKHADVDETMFEGDSNSFLAQDDEDSKDQLAPLISELRFGSSTSGSTVGIEDDDRAKSEADGSSRASEEPSDGVPASIRDSVASSLKPSAAEYRALSSKEKRQLRNKISARNFRERRKEYINHLEEEISDRDALISSLKTQLAGMSLQNKKLEDEVKTLQSRTLSPTDVQKILEALSNAAGLPTADAQSQQGHYTQATGIRPSTPADLALSSAQQASILSLSRPSSPSSPRPMLTRRGSPAVGTLPQHKDLSYSGSSSSSKSAMWGRNGPTVAASA